MFAYIDTAINLSIMFQQQPFESEHEITFTQIRGSHSTEISDTIVEVRVMLYIINSIYPQCVEMNAS